MKHLCLRSLVLIIFIILINNCAPNFNIKKDVKSINYEIQKVYNKAPENRKKNILVIGNKRLEYFKGYASKLELQIDTLKMFSTQLNEIEKKIENEMDLSNPKNSSIYNYIKNKKKFVGEQIALQTNNRNMSIERVKESIWGLINVVEESDLFTKVLCKMRDNGQIECCPISSIFAYYDNTIGQKLLEDIQRLYFSIQYLDIKDEILFECGDGYWGTSTFQELSSTGRDTGSLPSGRRDTFSPDDPDFLEDLVSSKDGFDDLCERINIAVRNSRDQLENTPGFSGITGFDTYGLLECYNANSDLGYFKNLFDQLKDISEKCESSIVETFMEAPSEPDDSEPAEEEKTVVSVETETITNKDGTTTYRTTTQYSDGSKHISGVVRDSNGNWMATHETDYYTDSDGVRHGTHHDTYSDGSSSLHFSTKYDDKIDVTRYYTDADGNERKETWRFKNNKAYLWENDRWKEIKSDQECIDESCSDCVSFVSNLEGYINGYLTSYDESYSSGRFTAHGGDCCNPQTLIIVDPSVVLPNSFGDFYCTGYLEIYDKQDWCEERCKNASGENCISNCMEYQYDDIYNYDLMDGICSSALWEECYQGESDFPLILPPDEPGNIPIPPYIEDHLLLPQTTLEFSDIQDLIDIGLSNPRDIPIP